MAPRIARIVRPATSAATRKPLSAAAPRPVPVRALAGGFSVARATGLLRDLTELIEGLRGQVRRERRVPYVLGEALTVREDEVQPPLQGAGGGGIRLLLVEDDPRR